MNLINLFLTLLLLILHNLVLNCQVEPPVLKFINLEPKWTYVPKDTNYAIFPIDVFGSPYSKLSPQDYLIKGESIYLLDNNYSKNPYLGDDGCLVHCLDFASGELNWIYHNNKYSGNTNREQYIGRNLISENSDGNIEMLGKRDIMGYDTLFPSFQFDANPIRRTIDPNNGNLINIETGSSLLKFPYKSSSLGTGVIFKLGEDKHLYGHIGVEIKNDSLTEFIYFREINSSFDISDTILAEIKYETGKAEVPYSYQTIFDKINKDTVIALFGSLNRADLGAPPTEIALNWIDISSSDNIKSVKELKLDKDLVYRYDNPLPINFHLIDNNIVLAQHVSNEDESLVWLLWLNSRGEQKAKIEDLIYGDTEYLNIFPIKVHDNKLYIAANIKIKEDGISGFDFLRLSSDGLNIEKLGSLLYKNSDSLSIQNFLLPILLPDGNVILGMIANRKEESRSKRYSYYFCFDGDDLGLDLLSSSNEIDSYDSIFSISPNPTSGYLTFEFKKVFSGKIEIFNIDGSVINNFHVTNVTKTEFSLESLSNGIYILRATDDSGRNSNRKIIIQR